MLAAMQRRCPHWLNHGPKIVAHRGASDEALENTLAAFHIAVELGVAIELDVRLLADDTVVVLHDHELSRLTGVATTIDECTRAQLPPLRSAAFDNASISIPTLAEVLAELPTNYPLMIEVKCDNGMVPDRFATALAAVLESIDPTSYLVMSFNPLFLAALRKVLPAAIRAILTSTYRETDIPVYQKLLLRSGLLNIAAQPDGTVHERVLLPSSVDGRGGPTGVWVVDTEEQWAHAISTGASALITNHPRQAQKWIEGHKQANG